METRLPQAKLFKAQKLLTTLWPQKTTTLSELQSLIGYLCFCSKVIPIGRSFLRHLYNATTGHKSKRTTTRGQPIPVTDNMRLDLRWWRDFLPQWNGITLIHKNCKTIYLWTDASGTKGQGAYFTDTLNGDHLVDWEHAFSKTISRHHRHKDINYLEMHKVLLALQRWHLHFADCRLVIHTDNTTVLSGLRRLSVRGDSLEPLRNIALCAAHNNIEIHARWIPTYENTLADLLSRRDFNKIANQFPLLSQIPRASHGIHPNGSMQISAYSAKLTVTSSGDSAPIPDEHTIQPAAATLPTAHSTARQPSHPRP